MPVPTIDIADNIGSSNDQMVPGMSHRLKISVVGAGGGIGQSLSLLLKVNLNHLLFNTHSANTGIDLSLFDVNLENLKGVAADLSHINNKVNLQITDNLVENVRDSNLIIITAGVPRKPGMTRDDLFNINAGIIKNIATDINNSNSCNLTGDNPNSSFVLLISNPLNSLLPVLQKNLNENWIGKCFGITELDLVRASTFLDPLLNNHNNTNNAEMPYIPVIGGHSGDTIVPVFSQITANNFTNSLYDLLSGSDSQIIRKLINRVQYGGDEIVEAKNGKGSATLSMAYSAYRIAEQFAALLLHQVDSIETILYTTLVGNDFQNPLSNVEGAKELYETFLESRLQYFATTCVVEKFNGLTKIDNKIISNLNEYEKNNLLPVCIENLQLNVDKGLKF